MLFKISLIAVLFSVTSVFSFAGNKNAASVAALEASFEEFSLDLYALLDERNLDPTAFIIALKGYYSLKAQEKITNNLLTVIDFNMSSSEERMFVIDMEQMQIVHKSLVAHGRKTGGEFASQFSNKTRSYKSSLGFFVTGEIYNGRRGLSLRIDGLESGYNTNVRSRGVVFHGSDYVSEDYLASNGRLGRSRGCTAIPKEGLSDVLDLLKDGSCVFAYYPKTEYLNSSQFLKGDDYLTGFSEEFSSRTIHNIEVLSPKWPGEKSFDTITNSVKVLTVQKTKTSS